MGFERVSAIDGEKIDIEKLNDIHINNKRHYIERYRSLSNGEIGCALSHRLIWKKILEQNLDYALILEDDVTINSDLTNILSDKIIKNYDFINLSSNHPYKINDSTLRMLLKQDIANRPILFSSTRKAWKTLEKNHTWLIMKLARLSNYNALCECTNAPAMASGYIVSAKAAKYFLKTSNNLFFPIDNVWRYSTGYLKQAFLATSLIVQTLNDTNIQNRVKQKISFYYKIIHFFYKLNFNTRKIQIVLMYRISLI
jgi:glycosyl transferase family 25